MLIEFDDSCIEIFNRNLKYKTFFNKLAYEVFEENNYYYFSKKMLEYLYKNEILGKEPREIYKRLFDLSFEDNLIKNSVNRKLKIVANTNFIDEIKFSNEEYIMELDKLIEIGIPDKIQLIAENYSDCRFYNHIGNAYKTKENIKNVKIKLDQVNAGGSTIYLEYTAKINEKKISILFVDTDKKYKNDKKGETLRKLLNERIILKRENNFKEYIEIKILDIHEVENLIPISMMKRMFYGKNVLNQKKETFDFFEKCINGNEEQIEALSFFDLKNGIVLAKLSNESYKKYWKTIIENVGEIFDENNLLKGIKRDLLNECLHYLENNIEKENFWNENIDKYLESRWNEIGQSIYSYGCARVKKVC